MKTLIHTLAVLAVGMFAAAANAHDYSFGDLRITHPWAKSSLKGVPNSAAYMTITNTGETDDTLVAAATDVSEAVELHTMTMEDGVMRMRRLENGVPAPAGETVGLEPGGKHIMLIGLKNRLEAEETFAMTLTFERAGEHRIEVVVRDRKPDAGESHNHGAHHQHGN